MKSKKRIAFLIRDLNHGGAAKMLVYVANIAEECFNDVYIIVIGEVTNHSLPLKERIKIKILDKAESKCNKIFRIMSEIKNIRNTVDLIKPDVLFPFVSGNVIFGYLAVKRRYYMVGAERGNPEVLPLKLKILCKVIYPKCTHMLFQSEGAAAFYFKEFNKKYRVIPNPCIIPDNAEDDIHTDREKIRIVSTSRLVKEKNIDVLLKAFKNSVVLEKAELWIYGEGNEEARLKNLTDNLALSESVRFCGKVDNVASHIKDADIFVLVSSGEGMPNGLVEAMALGIPCITTNCMANNTNSLVQNEVNGLIVKKRNVNELTLAINRLATDRELAEKLAGNALKIRDDLSEDRIHEMVRGFFAEVMVELEAD